MAPDEDNFHHLLTVGCFVVAYDGFGVSLGRVDSVCMEKDDIISLTKF